MKKILTTLCLFAVSLALSAQENVAIDVSQRGEKISPMIYGQFIEHLGRCINEDGIWAEKLKDRKFFYPVGSKESPWKPIYECQIRMDKQQPFAGKHSPESFTLESEQDRWMGVWQNKIVVQKNKKYAGYAWIKVSEGIQKVEVHFHWNPAKHEDFTQFKLPVKTGDYYKIEFLFEAVADSDDVMLEVAAFGKGTFTVGAVSLMPDDNVQGMRADVLRLLKELNSPIYRWPGGNFVSGYDWKDGIGDRDKRPPRKNPAWKGVEPNDFGIDEFLLFCDILKTEPYIAVNTGNGNIESGLQELEYLNGSAETPMGKLRAKNGHAEPYRVVYWGIGNEMYGNWQIGHVSVEEYIKRHNEFVDAFRKQDSQIKVIGSGNVGKWDEAFLAGTAKHLDLISEHFYVGEKKNVAEHVRQVPNSIKRIADAHRQYRKTLPNFKDVTVPITMDEWNYWYGEHVFGELGTRYFIKDGLGIAAGLHEFFRNSDIYAMANYAQTVNVIGCIKTNATSAQFETTGLVLKLYRNEFGSVPLKVTSPQSVDAMAALTDDGKIITVGLVNPSDKETAIKIDAKEANFDQPLAKYEISDNNPMSYNDPAHPQKINIVQTEETRKDGILTLKPYSVTVVKIGVK